MRQFWNEYLCRELIIVAVDFSFASTWHFLRPYAVTRQVQGDDERSRHLLLSEPRVSSFVGGATQRHIGFLLLYICIIHAQSCPCTHMTFFFWFPRQLPYNKTISTAYSYSRKCLISYSLNICCSASWSILTL